MELQILECVAALCMGLSIARPFARSLWKLPGLVVCPFLALCVVAGIFPAYGFRPECIPLLLFAAFLFCANLPDFYALFLGLHSDTYRDKGPLCTIITAAVFIVVMWIAIGFTPSISDDLGTEGVKTAFLDDGKLHVRIYGEIPPPEAPAEEEPPAADESGVIMMLAEEAAAEAAPAELSPGRPLLILAPPVAASFTVCDEVAAALRDRGFTVLAFSRVNFDSPFFEEDEKPRRLSLPGFFRLAGALSRGTRNTAANASGRHLERVRQEDILFLLNEVSANQSLRDLLGDTDTNAVYLVGYGAGGAALVTLAGSDAFAARFPQARGIIAIEAPILSSLESDPLPPPPPPATNPFSALFQNIGLFIRNNSARKITHISNLSRPGLPCLFVVSDRVTQRRTGRYETILGALEQSRGPSLLAAVPGAGLFDYSSSPEYYPLLSALFRGSAQTRQKRDWPELTAALIANFAAIAGGNEAAKTHLVTSALDKNMHLEQGGSWHIPDVRTILEPEFN